MRYVYILKSINRDFCYIGSTNDIEKRLKEHQEGECLTTKRFLPVRLAYYEAFASDFDANTREIKLKHYGSSLQNLKKRIKKSLSGGAG